MSWNSANMSAEEVNQVDIISDLSETHSVLGSCKELP